ncbi:NfeD family protein [Affinibrenneria salicis]|uniref:NfeD family protein n=1 Tax=Affinibrenneria salicis TaxID=2590031 RepID=A0A5J5G0H0_9GAMM|nr:NfeD family protein [Affinibrenneria salicis]KAA9000019.1 NfeD family protein [Affinibrenneria salicis]
MIAELLTGHAHWLWLTLAGLLLAAEMLGAGGYLLWSGVSALITGLLVWLLPFSWPWQGALFAVLTIATAVLWWYWLRQRTRAAPPSTLNQRGQQLIGRHATLSEPLRDGIGHIRIGDGSWRVQCDQDLPAGSAVEVVAVEGITLRIRPL